MSHIAERSHLTGRVPAFHRSLGWGLTVLVGACTGSGLDDSRHPTASQAMALTAERDAVVIAHPLEGTVSHLSLDGDLKELQLDGAPTRVVALGNRYFVTLRQAGAVAVLEVAEDNGLSEVERIEVGAEPFGLVAPENGKHVYVSVALEGVVKEINANSLKVTREFEVGGEPRWLAHHPAGVLYAMSAWNGDISEINLSDETVSQHKLPQKSNRRSGPLLVGRTTGDPAVTPDGDQLMIPAIYVDTVTTIKETDDPLNMGGYASNKRFQPCVVVVDIESDGQLVFSGAETIAVAPISLDPDVPGFMSSISGYPSSVAVSPNGNLILLTIEGGEGIAEMPRHAISEGSAHAIVTRPTRGISTRAGPRSIVFNDDDEAIVFSFLDRTLQRLDRDFDGLDTTQVIGVSTTVQLPPDVELGRRLFYASSDSRMSARGSGLSCATCHFDGRTDGLSWTFERGKRQTPSLAGLVSNTEPVRWDGERETVQEDARLTASLMGGKRLKDQELDALAAFIDFTPPVDSPRDSLDQDSVARGRQLFARADVGCINCHNGAAHTDNKPYAMFGLPRVFTRSLIGIAGSPPYFHDGSAPTLKDVLQRARDGSMGNTGSLSEAEMIDLEQYLKSL